MQLCVNKEETSVDYIALSMQPEYSLRKEYEKV